MRTGLFYVIDGFLDILLPVEEGRSQMPGHSKSNTSDNDSWYGAPEHLPDAHKSHKLLFTVKPGGIAGYLGEK